MHTQNSVGKKLLFNHILLEGHPHFRGRGSTDLGVGHSLEAGGREVRSDGGNAVHLVPVGGEFPHSGLVGLGRCHVVGGHLQLGGGGRGRVRGRRLWEGLICRVL